MVLTLSTIRSEYPGRFCLFRQILPLVLNLSGDIINSDKCDESDEARLNAVRQLMASTSIEAIFL